MHQMVKRRIESVLEKRKVSSFRVSVGMGKSRQWLHRKLHARPLTLIDCDQVLAYLDLRPDILLSRKAAPFNNGVTMYSIVQARLRAVLTAKGLSPYTVAIDMGKSKQWLMRKLAPLDEDQARPLTLIDCEQVLDHLGLRQTALFSPVLLTGDLGLLRTCETPEPLDFIEGVYKGSGRILTRLKGQGLVYIYEIDGVPHVQTSPAGLMLAKL